LEAPPIPTLQQFVTNDEPSADASSDEQLVVFVEKKLANGSTHKVEADGWYFDYDAAKRNDDNRFLWKHERVSKLLESPSHETQTLLRKAARSDKKVIAANATIGLARIDGPKHLNSLQEVIANESLSINIRRAAIETLFSLKGEGTHLSQQQAAERFQETGPKYIPELHIEILRHCGKVANETDYELLIQNGLKAKNADVKIATLLALADRPLQVAPRGVWELVEDNDPKIRVAAINLLGEDNAGTDHDQFKLFRLVSDSALEVRLAVIRAVGRIGNQSQLDSLRARYATESPRTQTEILRSLTTAGDLEFVFQQIDAEQWRVRMAIAEALEADSTSKHRQMAERLLNDESGEVRLRALKAIENWDPLVTGDLLFHVAKNDRTYRSRRAATRAIASRVLAEDQIADFLSSRDEKKALLELKTMWDRQLVQSSTKTYVDTKKSSTKPAKLLAKLDHHHPIERQLGCEFLLQNPDPLQLDKLLKLTNDSHSQVARAALLAVGTNGGPEHLEYLSTRLSDEDHLIRVAAGYAMAKLGSSRGVACLNRLARDKDVNVQINTLTAMGELRNPLFAAAVLPLLDGDEAVQKEALRVLPELVGPETAASIVNPNLPVAIQIGRWRKWYESGGDWGKVNQIETATSPNSRRRR
jgi:HEAT repeat protein